jgi:diaphanous 1
MTQEEIEAYESLEALPGEFESSEQILINIKNIKYSKEKFKIWSNSLTFEDIIESLEHHIKAYKGSFQVILNSKTLKKVLSYTLAIGNILNGDTNKGQADGFTLDAISKLSNIKDNNGKTILQLIASKIKHEDDEFCSGNIKKEFEICEEAIKVPLNESKAEVDKLLKITNEDCEIFNKIKADDNFMKKIKNIIFGNQERIKKLENLIIESNSLAQKTISFFGYPKNDIKYKKPDDFLTLVYDFSKELDKAIPVTEAKKAFKGTQPMGKKITGPEKNGGIDNLLSGLKAKIAS